MSEVNIKTIAQEAGVSISLVSQVLNDRPVRVSPETSKRIRSVAERYHYVPNRMASCLKSKETKTIALLAPFTPFGFFSNLIYNVQKYACQAGYLTMVINTFEDEAHEVHEMSLYRSGMFDGMIVAPLAEGRNVEVFSKMEEDSFPFVFVDRSNPAFHAPLVASDHEKIGYEMTLRAIRKGMKDIVFAYREGGRNSSGILRREGYLHAMKDSGLASRCVDFTYSGKVEDDLVSMKEALASLQQWPDAFFIHSGYYLPLLLQGCVDSGHCLDSLSFLTVDGYSLTEDMGTMIDQFHTISGRCLIAIQDIDVIAKHAVDMLLSRIRKEPIAQDTVMVMPKYQIL